LKEKEFHAKRAKETQRTQRKLERFSGIPENVKRFDEKKFTLRTQRKNAENAENNGRVFRNNHSIFPLRPLREILS
jgi:hypothetical protein